MSERGHKITVYTSLHPNADISERTDGVQVERFNFLNPHIAKFIKVPLRIMPGMFKLIGNNEIQEADVVQSFFFMESVSLVAYLLKLVQKRFFVLNPLFYPSYAPRTARKYLKWSVMPYRFLLGTAILKSADFLVPETHLEKENLIQLGIPSNKIKVIPNAIDSKDYAQLPNPMFFRKKYGIDSCEKLILFLSRPSMWKGIDHVVMAMKEVVEKIEEAKLVVVGPNASRPYMLRDSLPSKVQDHIVITGPVTEEDKLSAYSAADLFVLPSKIETFGIVTLEAAAAGLPVVSTRTGVASDIITNGKNGLFVEWGKVRQISNAISQVLTDHEFKSEAEKKRSFILQNYNVKAEIDQYERIYTQLLC